MSNILENVLSKSKMFCLEICNAKYFILLYIFSLLLFISIECFEGIHFEYEWVFCLFLVILGIFLTSYSFLNIEKLHRIAFVIILVFGLFAVFSYPILSLPDEVEHFTRSEITSHGDLFVQGHDENGYQTIKSTTTLIDHSYEIAWNNPIIYENIDYSLSYENSAFAQNLFYCYLPQSAGILLVKLLDLNAIWMLYLGRLFNLIVYACISAFAIRKAPFFKLQLFVVACLPLSIQQAASMSSDAMFISLGLLSLSYFFYLYKKSENSISFNEIVIFFTLCLAVTLIKPPFIMLAILILLIPKSKFKSKKEYNLVWLGLLLFFVIVLLWNLFYAVPQLNNSSRNEIYLEYGIDAKNQLRFMFNNIPKTLLLFMSPDFIFIVFGRVFYFGDIMTIYNASFMSKSLFLLFVLYYILLFLYPKGDLKISKHLRIGVFIVSSVIYLGVLGVQYLTWTPVGANSIGGLQGRYILPILALLPLSFTFNTNFDFLNNNKKELNLVFIILMIVFLSSVFLLLIHFYYMSGQYGGRSIINTMDII